MPESGLREASEHFVGQSTRQPATFSRFHLSTHYHWAIHEPPCFQILSHHGYFAVKPEGGGGSEDGSDMEAEPGIPLKVNQHFSPLLKCSCLIHLLLLIPSEPPPLPGLKSTSPAQAEEVSHHVHGLPAGRAGEGVREDPVPGHLHQGGAQSEDQAQ